MPAEQAAVERTAVLATVQVYFSDPEAGDDLVAGPLLEWSQLRGETPWLSRYEITRTLEDAQIVELRESTAVIVVRAEYRARVVRGRRDIRVRFDGPAMLEKIDGRWRVTDYTMNGRTRLQGLVQGPLAEQEQAGVTVRVLGVDRAVRVTELVIEIENASTDAVRPEHGYVIFEAHNSWRRVALGSREPVEPGTSRTLLLSASDGLDLSEPDLFMAIRLRSGNRRLTFLTRVPLTAQEAPVRQRPPKRLPLFRSTWPRFALFWAAVSAAAAWWYEWWALVVPLYVVLALYASVRNNGRLPARLYPLRHAVDAAVVLTAFLVLWETPAAELAVPALVTGIVYAALTPLRRRSADTRLVVALCSGLAWLFLLGLDGRPLSPCRLADGTSASTADRFAHAVLTGDLATVRRLQVSRFTQPAGRPVDDAAAAAEVRTRRPMDCFGLSGRLHCYAYRKPTHKLALWVLVSCHGRSWRVGSWFRLP